MSRPTDAYLPIEEYALIGDCGSAALVSRHGSIDWLCWPRFDSPSVFAALLDAEQGGFFYVRPAGAYTARRRYVDETAVLETTFRCERGVLRLTDLMPVASQEAYENEFWSDRELLRRVECVEGEVEVEIACDPRLYYGRVNPPLSDRGPHGFFYNYRGQVLVLRSEIPLALSENRGCLHARTTLRRGDVRFLALVFDQGEPAVLPLLGEHAARKLERTLAYWRTWAGRCRYEGPYRHAVVRSALTLKLLTYARSGAIVAAPTTSLPEALGGARNFDYRYCWLRDAALTLRALFGLGYEQEGQAFFAWLLHATRTTAPRLHVLYDVHGNAEAPEEILGHLEGYRGSQPVRVGNDAQDQLQLDNYGEVVSAAYEFVRHGGRLNASHARLLRRLGDATCHLWREPDAGIWEERSEPRHHTYSKVMCWVALDRLLRLHKGGLVKIPAARYRQERDKIREVVEARGYNEKIGSYVAALDGERLDASLLLLPAYGYTEADAPRMRSTFECIQERLGVDGLMYRYEEGHDDGFASKENPFGICSFWDEAYLARLGRVQDAKAQLDRTLSYANDVGLFAEEIDPETGAALGNFPQAFTHIGLINAVLAIAAAEGHPVRRTSTSASLEAGP